MNISDIIPNSTQNHKRASTQTDTVKIIRDRMKSGLQSPYSGVSSQGGYQVTDPKIPDDMSENDVDLSKIIAETMPKNYGKSRYPNQKMYETEQSFKRNIWKHAKNILEKEENEIKE